MIGRRQLAAAALGVTFALVAVACGGGSTTGGGNATGAATRGGTIREEYLDSGGFGWTGNFDPTGEYLGYGWGMLRGILAAARHRDLGR